MSTSSENIGMIERRRSKKKRAIPSYSLIPLRTTEITPDELRNILQKDEEDCRRTLSLGSTTTHWKEGAFGLYELLEMMINNYRREIEEWKESCVESIDEAVEKLKLESCMDDRAVLQDLRKVITKLYKRMDCLPQKTFRSWASEMKEGTRLFLEMQSLTLENHDNGMDRYWRDSVKGKKKQKKYLEESMMKLKKQLRFLN